MKSKMKSNFAQLESAGLVSVPEDENGREKIRERAEALRALAAKMNRIELGIIEASLMPIKKQQSRIALVLAKVEALASSPLPIGAKKHLHMCVNELRSIRDSVKGAHTPADATTLKMLTTSKVKEELLAMAASAEARLERIVADSSSSSDLEKFYKNAEEVIKKNSSKSMPLMMQMREKAFVIARAPVVPADGGLSAEKAALIGLDVESLGGYPVFNNQLVIGISPKALLGPKAAEVKSERAGKELHAEADRLRKLMQKKQNARLQFVSDRAYMEFGGAWFWLMSDRDIDRLAKVSPGNHIKITRWGFAW